MDYLCIAVPFLLAILSFYISYCCMFKGVSSRVRSKRLSTK